MKAKVGFTLLEVSLVVAIISTSGGIVAPGLTASTMRARQCSFKSDMQTIRCQLELYKIQHSGQFPSMGSFEDFSAALTTKGGDGTGPYLREVPANPFNGDGKVRFEGGRSTAGSGKAGWVFNTTTGAFQADDSVKHAAL